MNRIARRAWITLVLVLTLLGGFSWFGVQYFMNSENWVITSGSPHVYNGNSIGCGVAVDRDGVLLMDLSDGRQYTDDDQLRKAVVHWVGDRYGNINAPALSAHAADLAGYDTLNGLYSYGENAGVAQLCLSAQLQTAALEAMGSYSGTVAVYNYKTGQLLCAVTTPTYDPDNAPDLTQDQDGQYEGIYLNRFTQSSYIPGSIFKVVTLAAALETIPDIQEQTFTCTGELEFGIDKITCESVHGQQDLQSAFRNSCNCAFAQIALQVGDKDMDRYVKKFGITESVSFDGIVTAEGNYEVLDAADVNIGWSGIGQYNDQINPCAYLTFIGAIANEGQQVFPYLVEQVTVGNTRTYQAKTQTGDKILSDETVQILRQYLRNNVQYAYGDGMFGGLSVCAKTGTAEVGGDKKPNAMLVGFVTDEEYPLAFIVCAEDAGYGSTVCMPIASKVLASCKAYLDG